MSARWRWSPILPKPGAIAAWRCATCARHEEALASFDQVLRLEPRNAVAWNSRGNVLRDIKDYDAAIECYSRAIEIRPDYAEALINRGYTYWTLKQYDAGMADVERGLALEPDYPYGRGEVLHVRMYSADWHDFAARKAELEKLVRAGKRAVQPFIFQAIAETPEDAQACSRIWAQDKYPALGGAPHDPAARKGTREDPHRLSLRRIPPAGHRHPDGGPV